MSDKSNTLKSYRWLLQSCVLALVVVGVAFLGACLIIGSPQKVLANFRGELIFVERRVADLGKLHTDDERTVEFIVANTSRRPIKILKTRTSCSCTSAVPSFPIVVGPFSEKTLTFKFHAFEGSGSFSEFVEIDSDVHPAQIHCRIVGTIDPKSASTLASP